MRDHQERPQHIPYVTSNGERLQSNSYGYAHWLENSKRWHVWETFAQT